MKLFDARHLIEGSHDLRREICENPVMVTEGGQAPYVVMTLGEFVRITGAEVKVTPGDMPDSVAERLQAIADRYPDVEADIVYGDDLAHEGAMFANHP